MNITILQGRTQKVREVKEVVKGFRKGTESRVGRAELSGQLQGGWLGSGLGGETVLATSGHKYIRAEQRQV